MAGSFQKLDNILRGWAKDKVQKKSCRGIEQVPEEGRKSIKQFLLEKDLKKKCSSSLSRQSNETKPSTKLVLVSWGPLPYLEFNKSYNQMSLRLIYLNNLTFSNISVDTDILMSGMKHENITFKIS